jgi:hypothetical protein
MVLYNFERCFYLKNIAFSCNEVFQLIFFFKQTTTKSTIMHTAVRIRIQYLGWKNLKKNIYRQSADASWKYCRSYLGCSLYLCVFTNSLPGRFPSAVPKIRNMPESMHKKCKAIGNCLVGMVRKPPY